MANLSQQQKNEVREHFSQIRNNLDRSIEDAKSVGTKMMGFNKDEVLGLGLETVQRSLEHSRAIINQSEKSWETQLETAGR